MAARNKPRNGANAMVNPFPGMNPYLENPSRWRPFHTMLMATINEVLNQQLPPGFVASIEERVYLTFPSSGIYPDLTILERPLEKTANRGNTLVADPPLLVMYAEEVTEKYVEIRAADSDERVITLIEVLSPTNKSPEAYGRDAYTKKRDRILQSETHLLEIDLLRGGVDTVAVPRPLIIQERGEHWRYVVCLHRTDSRHRFEVWPFALSAVLPRLSVPLTIEYPDFILDLSYCVSRAYETSGLGKRINYHDEPTPPLTDAEKAWANNLLIKAGLRDAPPSAA